jgi:chloramphenicol 3-O-phosphotransferase
MPFYGEHGPAEHTPILNLGVDRAFVSDPAAADTLLAGIGVIVQPGYLIWRDSAPALHRGYLAAIAALAGAGNHVTLSAAGHTCDEIIKAFSGIQVISVGMRCDFDVLVDREQRTGRWAGIAGQSLGVHDGWACDLEIDTTNGPDPLELARRVLVLGSD